MPGPIFNVSSSLTQNPPLSRFKYIAKIYGEKHPDVVLATFMALADTVGIERPEREFDFARRFDFYGRAPSEKISRELLADALEELQNEPRMKRGRESDALWPWLARELVRIKKAARRYDTGWRARAEDVEGKGPAIALWQQQNRIDLGQWRIPAVLDALEDFEVEQRGVPQGEIVYEFGDGWTVQELEADDLEAEGEAMQHCVGSYCDAVQHGTSTIYSLRDPQGQPHATIEFDTELDILKQIQGKQNHDPEPKYQARVDEFLASDAAPSMGPHVKEVYDALVTQFGNDDDIGYVVREWIDDFSGDAVEWIDFGFGWGPREAQTLYDLGVRPADLNDWPSVVWSYWRDNLADGWASDVEAFVRIVKIATMIHKLDAEREASGAAREFAKQIDFPFVQEERPRTSLDWDWRYNQEEREEWEPILAEAEQWAETELDLDDVEGWYSEFFSPGMAVAWEDVGVAPTVASVLRAERVTPMQVYDAVESGRLSDRYPSDLEDVDKVLRAMGIAANRRRAR